VSHDDDDISMDNWYEDEENDGGAALLDETTAAIQIDVQEGQQILNNIRDEDMTDRDASGLKRAQDYISQTKDSDGKDFERMVLVPESSIAAAASSPMAAASAFESKTQLERKDSFGGLNDP